jgi:hypothetical protein
MHKVQLMQKIKEGVWTTSSVFIYSDDKQYYSPAITYPWESGADPGGRRHFRFL